MENNQKKGSGNQHITEAWKKEWSEVTYKLRNRIQWVKRGGRKLTLR